MPACSAPAAICKRAALRQLSKDLAAANEQRAVVTAQATKLASLQAELKQARPAPGLIAYLQHPWPRTQIVAAVVQPLLEGLSLSELRVQRLESMQAAVRSFGSAASRGRSMPPTPRRTSARRPSVTSSGCGKRATPPA